MSLLPPLCALAVHTRSCKIVQGKTACCRLVHISWEVYRGSTLCERVQYIIYPDGWTPTEEQARSAGVSYESMLRNGTPIHSVIEHLGRILPSVHVIVGHDMADHNQTLGSEILRAGRQDLWAAFHTPRRACTMELGRKPKMRFPSLIQLYERCYGTPPPPCIHAVTLTALVYFYLTVAEGLTLPQHAPPAYGRGAGPVAARP